MLQASQNHSKNASTSSFELVDVELDRAAAGSISSSTEELAQEKGATSAASDAGTWQPVAEESLAAAAFPDPAPEAPLLSLLGGLFSGNANAAPALPPGGGPGADHSGASDIGAHPASSSADPVREFEQAVEELGKKTAEAAAEAKESLSKVAHGLSSWFASSLDSLERSAKGGGRAAAPPVAAGMDAMELQALLGLEAREAVLESFACQLLQTYTCTSNFFTPVRTIPFPGTLHVTSHRIAFVFASEGGDSGIAPIKVPTREITGVARQRADAAGPDRIVVQLAQAKQALALAHFSLQGLEMDSALALLEHAASSA